MNGCPDWTLLSLREDGVLSAPQVVQLEAHLHGCGSCRARRREISSLRDWFSPRSGRGDSSPAVGGGDAIDAEEKIGCFRPGPRLQGFLCRVSEESGAQTSPSLPFRKIAVRAAGLLLAAGLLAWGGWEGFERLSFPAVPPAARWVEVLEEPGSRWQWMPGDENRVSVRSGTVTFHVPPGIDGVMVETSVGSIEVLGTRFTVRLIDLPSPDGEGRKRQSVLVDLSEGRVRLTNRAGETQVLLAPRLGVMVPGFQPYLVEPSGGRFAPEEAQAVWRDLMEAYRNDDRRRAGYLVTMLALQGEKAIRAGDLWRRSQGGEGEWVRRTWEALRFSGEAMKAQGEE